MSVLIWLYSVAMNNIAYNSQKIKIIWGESNACTQCNKGIHSDGSTDPNTLTDSKVLYKREESKLKCFWNSLFTVQLLNPLDEITVKIICFEFRGRNNSDCFDNFFVSEVINIAKLEKLERWDYDSVCVCDTYCCGHEYAVDAMRFLC